MINTDSTISPGLAGLVLISRFHGIPSDPEKLKREFSAADESFGDNEIVRAAKGLGLRARVVSADWDRLSKIPLPAIAIGEDGGYLFVGKIDGDQLLVQSVSNAKPSVITRAQFERRWFRKVILFTKRQSLGELRKKFDFSWFIPSIIRYKRLLIEVVVASLFIQLLALITPLFFQVVIDKVLVHQGLTTLDVLAFGLITVSLFEVVLTGLRTYVFSHTTNRVDVELGSRLYRHLQKLPISYFQARSVGSIVARVRELDTVRGFLTGSSLTLIIDLSFTFVFLSVMYLYSPMLFGIVLASIPFYVGLAVTVTPVLRKRLDEKFARNAEVQSFLVESVTGAETVKSMAIESNMQRRWEDRLAAYVSSAFKASNLGNIAGQFAGFVSKATTVAILWIGARLVITGELTVGQLVAFNMLAARVSGPILRLVQLWQEFQQAGISVEKLGDVLNASQEPGNDSNQINLPKLSGQVVFENVTFRYTPDQSEVLQNISLDIAPGEVIGIVGRSGSGKSTLSRLIQRFYVPTHGRILIDGVDLAIVDPTWLRRQIGVVLQDNYLFNRSVRENIALADPGMPIEKVVEAARLAEAHEFILELPFGYDTLIDEHGSNLSGGQRQRIAIARALATNPRILVFDEATSALDYESERAIQDNMRRISEGRTVFVIAHRLSAVRDANRILVIDRGQIVEQGAHADLAERDGYYAALYQHQVAMTTGDQRGAA